MTTKQKVERFLAEFNGSIDGPYKDGRADGYSANIDTPAGFVWTHTGTHCVCITGAPDKRTLWQWVWEDIGEEGVTECPDLPGCDICASGRDQKAA